MLNACDFCNLFVFCMSYIRSDFSFKYLAAILDAILDFSKCTRVTGSHTTDSKRGYLPNILIPRHIMRTPKLGYVYTHH